MRQMHNNKKAVSPVIATVLMILIVMAGMTLLFAFVGTYAQSFQAGSGSAVKELLTVENHWFKPDPPSDHKLYLWIYNIGEVEFRIDSVYVNDVKIDAPVLALYDQNNVPRNLDMPITSRTRLPGSGEIGPHVKISVTTWVESGENYVVKIVTKRGSAFEGTYVSP
jgi:flagellin-like protein